MCMLLKISARYQQPQKILHPYEKDVGEFHLCLIPGSMSFIMVSLHHI